MNADDATQIIDWNAVYADELPRVYNFFRCRVYDHLAAEDLTTTTFEKAWRRRDQYRRNRSGFSTPLLKDCPFCLCPLWYNASGIVNDKGSYESLRRLSTTGS